MTDYHRLKYLAQRAVKKAQKCMVEGQSRGDTQVKMAVKRVKGGSLLQDL